MSHWDVARASTFLLSNSTPLANNTNTNRSSLRKPIRSDYLNSNSTSSNASSPVSTTTSSRSSVVSNENVAIDIANSNTNVMSTNSSSEGQQCARDYIRPTRV